MIPVSDFVARFFLVDLSIQPKPEVYILACDEGLLLQFVPRCWSFPLIRTSPPAIIVLLLPSFFTVPKYTVHHGTAISTTLQGVFNLFSRPSLVLYAISALRNMVGPFGEISEVFRQHSKLS